MSDNPYALLVELTIVVALLVSLVVYAMLRFMEAARTSRRRSKDSKRWSCCLRRLHDAVAKLQAQERATAARADASERLSEEIILSLTAGLLVVDLYAQDSDSQSSRPSSSRPGTFNATQRLSPGLAETLVAGDRRMPGRTRNDSPSNRQN